MADKLELGFLRAFFSQRLALRHSLTFGHEPKIYHYTSTAALLGIVSEGSFHMGHYAFMNDAVEYRHGRDTVIAVLKRLNTKSRYRATSDLFDQVIAKLEASASPNYFVCCFSTQQDSLEQWRAYGGEQGVNIELSLRDGSYGGALNSFPHLGTHRALYDEAAKLRAVAAIASTYALEYRASLIRGEVQAYGKTLPDWTAEWADHFAMQVGALMPCFKHPAFRSESEVRFVVQEAVAIKNNMTIRHHARSGIIVPYLSSAEYSKSAGKLHITAITVGPRGDRELVVRSIREFMRRSGYDQIEIRQSAAPYRTHAYPPSSGAIGSY